MLSEDFDLELRNFSLRKGTAISADGQAIVGMGTADDSPALADEAWLVTLKVPEPSGVYGLCLGLLTATALRRNRIRDYREPATHHSKHS